MSSNTKFRYQPLNASTNDIRVLRILPGRPNEKLQCELLHTPLNESSNYEALSYAWSDPVLFKPEEKEWILVNDRYLEVGKNLACCLHAARPQSGEGPWMWIDAICINQESIPERNIQVLRMRQIYELANRVVVWLGPSGYESNAAFAFLHFILKECPPGGEATWFKALVRKCPLEKEWGALRALLARSWWTRIWIVQEVVLARKLIVHCGSSSLTWEQLESSIDLIACGLDAIRKNIQELTNDNLIRERVRAIARLSSTRRRHSQEFIDVIDNIGGNDCTKLHDKVYGLLGLIKNAEMLVPSPNYELSVPEVYQEAFAAVAVKTRSLKFLSLLVNRYDPFLDNGNNQALPTWCPDMTSRYFNIHRLNPALTLPDNTRPQFSASGTRPADADALPSKNSKILTVSGIWIDTVDGVFPGGSGNSSVLKSTKQARSKHSAYGDEKHTFAALWNSLVAGIELYSTNFEDHTAPERFGELFARKCCIAETQHRKLCREGQEKPFDINHPERSTPAFVDEEYIWAFNKWYKFNREACFAGLTIKDWAELFNPVQDDIEGGIPFEDLSAWKAFADSWGPVDFGRRVVTTESGRIGTALESVRSGDLVCILFGADLPVILRTSGNCFQVVGESYIHGLMFGEAIEDLRRGRYEVKDFRLC